MQVRPFFCITTPILDNNLLIWLGSAVVCKASCPILLKHVNYSSLNDKIRETLTTMNIKHLIMIIKELFKPTARCPSSWTTSRGLLWNFSSFEDFVFIRLQVVNWAIWAGLKKLSLISCPLDIMSSSPIWLVVTDWQNVQQYQAYHCWIFSRILLSMFSFDCQTKLVKKIATTSPKNVMSEAGNFKSWNAMRHLISKARITWKHGISGWRNSPPSVFFTGWDFSVLRKWKLCK